MPAKKKQGLAKRSNIVNYDDDEKLRDQSPQRSDFHDDDNSIQNELENLGDEVDGLYLEDFNNNDKTRTIEVIRRLLDKKKVNWKNAFDYDLEDITKLHWFKNLSDDGSWKGITTTTKNNKELQGHKADALQKMYQQLINEAHNENELRNSENQMKDIVKIPNLQDLNLTEDFPFYDGQNTIEQNETLLQTNKIDCGYHLDPFFVKMSEKFEEAGSSGMLMNNLPLQKDLKLILDTTQETHTSAAMNENPFFEKKEKVDKTIFQKSELNSELFENFYESLRTKSLCDK